ncbi:hypothetical protein [Rhizobium sp. PL01]|uniref:hypothetical protein n=1 Tax=Rhizobium sp. PL01 TaxID=3085631 RepID=UPI00298198DE|nr:hypothetical protein [Rhizobium sp. PL01]MDW5314526.1 hypothetical protein [Rhizobium sp. PL01]
MSTDRTDLLLGFVVVVRAVPLLVFASLVFWTITLVANRSEAPEPVTRVTLQRNHLIGYGDLQTPALTGLVGKYLKEDVAAGGKVTNNMVQGSALPPRMANTMAAIISIPVLASQSVGIKPGLDVYICDRKRQGVGGLTKVISVDCDETFCQVTIKLSKIPGQTVDPDILKDASLVGAQYQNCSMTKN